MAHINLNNLEPGIRSLALYRPDTGKYLYELVAVLLRGKSELNAAERELIAAFVSNLNNCTFCAKSHAAAAKCLYGDEAYIVDDVLDNLQQSSISEKLKALLNIAGKVQILGKKVSKSDIDVAKKAGATDSQIHDTVLISATFSMFNRYVEGLNTFTPMDDEAYIKMGEMMVTNNYSFPKTM